MNGPIRGVLILRLGRLWNLEMLLIMKEVGIPLKLLIPPGVLILEKKTIRNNTANNNRIGGVLFRLSLRSKAKFLLFWVGRSKACA